MSTRTIRPGCSSCAVRTRPRTAEAAGSEAAFAVRTASGRAESPARCSWIPPSAAPTSARAACGADSPSGARVRSSTSSSAGRSTALGRSTGAQSRQYRCSAAASRAVDSRSGATGRRTSAPTAPTGRPTGSVSVKETLSGPSRRECTRSAAAPDAYRATSFQANGSSTSPGPATGAAPRLADCRAASSRAGCSPNPPAKSASSSGSATSANTSSPDRQAARRPRKASPYS